MASQTARHMTLPQRRAAAGGLDTDDFRPGAMQMMLVQLLQFSGGAAFQFSCSRREKPPPALGAVQVDALVASGFFYRQFIRFAPLDRPEKRAVYGS